MIHTFLRGATRIVHCRFIQVFFVLLAGMCSGTAAQADQMNPAAPMGMNGDARGSLGQAPTVGRSGTAEFWRLVWDSTPDQTNEVVQNHPPVGYPPNIIWYQAKSEAEHLALKNQGTSNVVGSAGSVAQQNVQGWEASPLGNTAVGSTALSGTPQGVHAPVQQSLPDPVLAAAPVMDTSLPNPDAAVTGSGSDQNSIYASNQPTNDFECGQAADEASKAASVSDSADKLFHLRKALRLCPGNASYHSQLADVYTSLGRTEDAKFEIEEARRIDPNIQAAQTGNSFDSGDTAGKYY